MDAKYDSHLIAARLENAQFMLDNGCPPEEMTRRLGVSVNTLQQSQRRSRERANDEQS